MLTDIVFKPKWGIAAIKGATFTFRAFGRHLQCTVVEGDSNISLWYIKIIEAVSSIHSWESSWTLNSGGSWVSCVSRELIQNREELRLGREMFATLREKKLLSGGAGKNIQDIQTLNSHVLPGWGHWPPRVQDKRVQIFYCDKIQDSFTAKCK